jgi:hypothetical protein
LSTCDTRDRVGFSSLTRRSVLRLTEITTWRRACQFWRVQFALAENLEKLCRTLGALAYRRHGGLQEVKLQVKLGADLGRVGG